MKKDDAIQFEPGKNANIYKYFYSESVGNLVRKLPAAPSEFNNNSKNQYYMNIEQNYHNLELFNATMETIKMILSFLNTFKAPGFNEMSLKFLKDGAEVLALPLCNLVNWPMKQSLFSDKCKIVKLQPVFKKMLLG